MSFYSRFFAALENRSDAPGVYLCCLVTNGGVQGARRNTQYCSPGEEESVKSFFQFTGNVL